MVMYNYHGLHHFEEDERQEGKERILSVMHCCCGFYISTECVNLLALVYTANRRRGRVLLLSVCVWWFPLDSLFFLAWR